MEEVVPKMARGAEDGAPERLGYGTVKEVSHILQRMSAGTIVVHKRCINALKIDFNKFANMV